MSELGKIEKQEITYEQFERLIVEALELGSSYWAIVDIKGLNFPAEYEDLTLTEKIARVIWYQNANIPIYHAVDDELLGRVNMGSVKTAYQSLAKLYPLSYSRIINGSFTEEDSDIFFQIAVLGFLRYV